MYIYIYICMYMYICMYIYIYIWDGIVIMTFVMAWHPSASVSGVFSIHNDIASIMENR